MDVIRHRSSDVYTAVNPMTSEISESRSAVENQGSEVDDTFVEIDVDGRTSKLSV